MRRVGKLAAAPVRAIHSLVIRRSSARTFRRLRQQRRVRPSGTRGSPDSSPAGSPHSAAEHAALGALAYLWRSSRSGSSGRRWRHERLPMLRLDPDRPAPILDEHARRVRAYLEQTLNPAPIAVLSRELDIPAGTLYSRYFRAPAQKRTACATPSTAARPSSTGRWSNTGHDAHLQARLAAMTPDERDAYEANRDRSSRTSPPA